MEKMIKKLKDNGDTEKAALFEKDLNQPAEEINTKTVSKKFTSDDAAIFFFDNLVDRYKKEEEKNMLELIKNVTKANSMWFS